MATHEYLSDEDNEVQDAWVARWRQYKRVFKEVLLQKDAYRFYFRGVLYYGCPLGTNLMYENEKQVVFDEGMEEEYDRRVDYKCPLYGDKKWKTRATLEKHLSEIHGDEILPLYEMAYAEERQAESEERRAKNMRIFKKAIDFAKHRNKGGQNHQQHTSESNQMSPHVVIESSHPDPPTDSKEHNLDNDHKACHKDKPDTDSHLEECSSDRDECQTGNDDRNIGPDTSKEATTGTGSPLSASQSSANTLPDQPCAEVVNPQASREIVPRDNDRHFTLKLVRPINQKQGERSAQVKNSLGHPRDGRSSSSDKGARNPLKRDCGGSTIMDAVPKYPCRRERSSSSGAWGDEVDEAKCINNPPKGAGDLPRMKDSLDHSRGDGSSDSGTGARKRLKRDCGRSTDTNGVLEHPSRRERSSSSGPWGDEVDQTARTYNPPGKGLGAGALAIRKDLVVKQLRGMWQTIMWPNEFQPTWDPPGFLSFMDSRKAKGDVVYDHSRVLEWRRNSPSCRKPQALGDQALREERAIPWRLETLESFTDAMMDLVRPRGDSSQDIAYGIATNILVGFLRAARSDFRLCGYRRAEHAKPWNTRKADVSDKERVYSRAMHDGWRTPCVVEWTGIALGIAHLGYQFLTTDDVSWVEVSWQDECSLDPKLKLLGLSIDQCCEALIVQRICCEACGSYHNCSCRNPRGRYYG